MAPLLFIGAAIGGAAMYFFDPDRGRRRRALVRDQAVRAQSNVRDMVDAGTRDLKNRGTVMLGRTRSLVTRRKPTDSVLAERVRSKMGRYAAHPGAIEVTAVDGEVTLKGSLFAHEHADLLDAVQGIAGVKHVRDELSIYETAQGISELQGQPRRRSQGSEFMDENWAAGPRLLAGAGAMTLALYGLRWHGIMRLASTRRQHRAPRAHRDQQTASNARGQIRAQRDRHPEDDSYQCSRREGLRVPLELREFPAVHAQHSQRSGLRGRPLALDRRGPARLEHRVGCRHDAHRPQLA